MTLQRSSAESDPIESAPEVTASPKLSVIVPLYNEEENVAPMHDAIVAALADGDLDYEIVFVDDGSRDETFERAAALKDHDPRVRVVKFRRNYGQTAAMAAGIEHARGEILVTMDGDLQNDPTDIPMMVAKIGEGYDLVVGWRHKRQDKFFTRILPSKIANWIIGKITGVPIKDNGCSLKVYRAALIKRISLYNEMHRFIPFMSSLAGSRIAEVKVKHHARRFGNSKYGLSRVYKVMFDLLAIKSILTVAKHPMKMFSGLFAIASVLSMVFFVNAFFSGEASVVFMGMSLLFGAMATQMGFAMLLVVLIFKTGTLRRENFVHLSARAVWPDNRKQNVT
ncbi:Undecaprenyl-phosphate 4-deoxy-4-formamido-L-arabinose transferase [Oceanibacterium hippocampi]|uniref:Undecaprenyl-phosphate 4-deoxy-4-formamido-L-arabinose transferase n=1 Tax=Oceanibacterium hippocampi TaxID=745714 RepID=A0A1Y5T761_9PROT|nr:Undecaprenyl-phosphate 4-deoxy-4-formamido-L-arabinose transferase [Oceanibacterium hippocampi]